MNVYNLLRKFARRIQRYADLHDHDHKKEIDLNAQRRSKMVCSLKKKYATESEAAKAAKHYWKQSKLIQRPYNCPECLQWHLTSRLPKITTNNESV